MTRPSLRTSNRARNGAQRGADPTDLSSIRLLEDTSGRRQNEVTLVAALILLIVLVASLARACPREPGAVSSSPTPLVLSSTVPRFPVVPATSMAGQPYLISKMSDGSG